MRKVISNTTPLLSLLKIDKLDLLQKLYRKVIVPYGVYQEIECGNKKPYYKDLRRLEWVDIQKVKNKDTLGLRKVLDKGEAEVLLLAKELDADLVVMDELLGRHFAKQMNISFTGTLGILLKAKEIGLIPLVHPLLADLRDKGTWIHPRLLKKILVLAKEENTEVT
jgi:predicted nucleic acid-binding protein